jgi:hypothetical protein
MSGDDAESLWFEILFFPVLMFMEAMAAIEDAFRYWQEERRRKKDWRWYRDNTP